MKKKKLMKKIFDTDRLEGDFETVEPPPANNDVLDAGRLEGNFEKVEPPTANNAFLAASRLNGNLEDVESPSVNVAVLDADRLNGDFEDVEPLPVNVAVLDADRLNGDFEEGEPKSLRGTDLQSSPKGQVDTMPIVTDSEQLPFENFCVVDQSGFNKNQLRILPFSLCEYIWVNHPVRANIRSKCLSIYSPKEGYYKRWDKNTFPLWMTHCFSQRDFFPFLNSSIINEIFQRLLATPDIQVEYDAFDREKRYVNVLNGVVDLRDGTLLPHSSKYLFASVLLCEYNEKYAKSGKMPKVFQEMLERHFPHPDDRAMFFESIAYLLSPECGKKIAFLWEGVAHTGKSTFQRLLTQYLGKWVTHHSLKQIASKHGTADFEYARVNICAEVEKTTLRNLDNFKSIVGNDYLSIEPKFQSLRSMKSTVKLLLIGNGFPQLAKGLGEPAVFDRIRPILFLNPYQEAERIPLFEEKIIKKYQVEIFSIIIQEICRLYANGYNFTLSQLSQKELRRFQLQNSAMSSVDCFVEDYCTPKEGWFWRSCDIFELYETYCSLNGFDVIPKGRFFREFAAKTDAMPKKKFDKATGKQCRGYMGIGPA